MNETRFRFVVADDCPALLSISTQYIRTPITFEYALSSEPEFSAKIAAIDAHYP